MRLVSDFARDENAAGEVVGHGTTLIITTKGYDSYHPERGETYRVAHYFIVPAATYNRASWQRWLYEQYAKVENHECMEHFVITNPDVCRHCGQDDEADGTHSCPCPNRDGECFDHLGDWAERPFAPLHGPGEDPYVVHEYASRGQKDRRYFDHSADEQLPFPT